MARRFVKLAALFTALHVVCGMTTFFYCFSRGMTRFGNPMLDETFVESLTCRAADVLFQPVSFVWSAVGIKGASSLFQWGAVLLNSAVWGITFSVAVVWLTRGSMRTRAKGARSD